MIDIGKFDVVAGHGLDLGGERSDLSAVLLVGGRDTRREQVASVSTTTWTFAPLRRFAPS